MKRIALVLCLWMPHALLAGDIQVESIETQWSALQLTARPQYKISSSEVIEEAINSGIVLSLVAKLHSYQTRDFWIDHSLKKQQKTYQIRYFSLSGQYQLHNIDDEERTSFISLSALWRHLERRTSFLIPLNTARQIDYFSVRIKLDAGALPSAMQLPVLLSNDWRFKSEWYEQPLTKPQTTQRL